MCMSVGRNCLNCDHCHETFRLVRIGNQAYAYGTGWFWCDLKMESFINPLLCDRHRFTINLKEENHEEGIDDLH